MILTRIEYWLEQGEKKLYYEAAAKNQLIKLFKYLEIFGFNSQNLLMLMKNTKSMPVIMGTIYSLDSSYEVSRPDNSDHNETSIELLSVALKSLNMILRSREIAKKFLLFDIKILTLFMRLLK